MKEKTRVIEVDELKPEAMILDMDNLLVGTMPFIIEHIRRTCRRLHIKPPSRKEIVRILKDNPKFEDIFDELFEKDNKPNNGAQMLAEYRSDAKIYKFQATEGGIEFVNKAVNSGVKLIIVTNRVNAAEERLGQAGYNIHSFLAILTPPGELKKPDPHSYDKAFEMLEAQGISRDKVVVIGDDPDDCLACPPDVPFIGVLTGPTGKNDFVKKRAVPHSFVDGLPEIEKVLQI
jgi:beta-phosphoglucomutase-like phosphatase (HAD superfamily)